MGWALKPTPYQARGETEGGGETGGDGEAQMESNRPAAGELERGLREASRAVRTSECIRLCRKWSDLVRRAAVGSRAHHVWMLARRGSKKRESARRFPPASFTRKPFFGLPNPYIFEGFGCVHRVAPAAAVGGDTQKENRGKIENAIRRDTTHVQNCAGHIYDITWTW